LLLMFLRGCVQGFTKSLAMTVLSEIRDKTFFAAAVHLLPPSPSRHVACSSSCPFAFLPCLFLRVSLSRVTA
jgi:putative Ca2+/H+ antiporter (TMEM165/GDT1 family)